MEKSKLKELIEWIYCIAIALILALLIRYFIGTPTIVKMPSMFPTLQQNQRLVLNRLSRTFKQIPNRGDIITFEAPSKSYADGTKAIYDNEHKNVLSKFAYYVLEFNKISYIKRVIALPGEHVEIKNGKVYINEELYNEEYLQEGVTTEEKNQNFN